MRIGIIGGGIAGLAVGREAILNGFDVTIFEKNSTLKGASVNNGAVLHSGARYLIDNIKIAKLCLKENTHLKSIAPFATGRKLGIFLVEKKLDKKIEDSFVESAKDIGMKVRRVDRTELDKKIKSLSPNITHAYETPDVIFNPYLLTSAYAEDILLRGGIILSGAEAVGINHRVDSIEISYRLKNGNSGVETVDYLINSSGPELSKTAHLYNSKIEVDNIEGSMYLSPFPVSDHFITTCGINFDGNAIVPVTSYSSIGSTWVTKEVPESKVIKEVQTNIKKLVDIDFKFNTKKTIKGYRTHFKNSDHTRAGIDYGIYSHSREGIANIYSVLPGKFVLHRLVAEEVIDNILFESGMPRLINSYDEPINPPKNVPKEMINYKI